MLPHATIMVYHLRISSYLTPDDIGWVLICITFSALFFWLHYRLLMKSASQHDGVPSIGTSGISTLRYQGNHFESITFYWFMQSESCHLTSSKWTLHWKLLLFYEWKHPETDSIHYDDTNPDFLKRRNSSFIEIRSLLALIYHYLIRAIWTFSSNLIFSSALYVVNKYLHQVKTYLLISLYFKA
jgi:hypothetical protein